MNLFVVMSVSYTHLVRNIHIEETFYGETWWKKNVREEIVPKIKVNGNEFERVDSFRYVSCAPLASKKSDGNGNSRQTGNGKYLSLIHI